MNKKVRILALTLAVAVALIGAGYAAWGTEITATTKMHSGEWRIVLENDSVSSYWAGDQIGYFERESTLSGIFGATNYEDLDKSYDAPPSGDDGAVSSDATDFVYVMEPIPNIPYGIDQSAEANITGCTFQFYNLHPGTKAFTRFEIRNDGTIDAKIGDVRVTLLKANGDTPITNANATTEEWDLISAIKVHPVFSIHNGNNGTDSLIDIDEECSLLELQDLLYEKLVGKVLNWNNKLYSYDVEGGVSDELDTGDDNILMNSFNFELPAEALEGNIGMQANFQVVIEFDFVQYNQLVDGTAA